MADKVLAARSGTPVSKNWPERSVSRTEGLKVTFNQAKGRQRTFLEDPEVISACFKLVQQTVVKYGVADDDIHNLDETSFRMGVIGFLKVVTGSGRGTRPNLIQPGGREWVTVIRNICATGYATPPFIIY